MEEKLAVHIMCGLVGKDWFRGAMKQAYGQRWYMSPGDIWHMADLAVSASIESNVPSIVQLRDVLQTCADFLTHWIGERDAA